MNEAIKNFATQFEWTPKIQGGALPSLNKFVVIGMGGSHLAGDLIKAREPKLDIIIHSDYGLPKTVDSSSKDVLIIASSYSGNTEEVVDAFNQARDHELPLVVIATGAKLIELAKEHQVPYIEMPSTGIQPRSALGYSIKAMAKAMRQDDLLNELGRLSQVLKPSELEASGKELAERIRGHVPIVYSSARNQAIIYNWKIKFNETGKIPSFYNIIPELNHNEMTGFDVKDVSRDLSKNFYFIFLEDDEDHPRVLKRMEILQKLYQDRGLVVESVKIQGKNRLEKIFSSLVLADWAAYYTSQGYGLESEQVPMIEEFKKKMRE